MDCCNPCSVTPPVNIPGPPGADGGAGTPGTDGINAFTIVAAPGFTVPAVGANVAVPVANNSWMSIGQNVFIEGPANFQVVSKTGTTSATLKFLGYTGDVAPATVIGAGAEVSPSGLQGPNAGFALIKVTNIFQGTVSYTPTAGCNALYVECIGAGGSGGGGVSVAADASVGSGGGGGGYSAVFITSPKANYTVQVGAGGAAPAAGNNPGNAGTDTTFDVASICTAKGGSGGAGGGAAGTTALLTAGGAGGAAGSGVGDIKLQGNNGGMSYRVSGTFGFAGRGGAGPLGGATSETIAQGNGAAGGVYGAGGAGGATINGGGDTSGGAGANGLIRVWEFK